MASGASPATREELLAAFGDEYLSIQSLFSLCFVPGGRLSALKDLLPPEPFGSSDFVLLKYLAVHLRVAVEQGRYTWNGEQVVLAAGRLASTAGRPLYVGLSPNRTPGEQPWVLNWVGERPSCEPPPSADLGPIPELDPGAEVVVGCELADAGVEALAAAPEATRIAAVAGAVHFALHRGLAVRQIHGGGRGWLVPLHLRDRSDLAAAPDRVAAVVGQEGRVLVRALLDPPVAYPAARAVVERREQLPAWVVAAWDGASPDADPR